MLKLTNLFVGTGCLLAAGISLFSQSLPKTARAMTVVGDFKVQSSDVGARDFTDRPVVWSGGALLAVRNNLGSSPVIHVFDAEGRDFPAAFSIADATWINMQHLAHADDGTLAATGFATDAQGRRAGFVSWIAPDHQSATTIRTGWYYPKSVAFAPDGTLWLSGAEGLDAAMKKKNFAGAVFRHFDRSGKLLDSLVSWHSMDRAWREGLPGLLTYMPSSSTRFGWMEGGGFVGGTTSAAYVGGTAYYEISFDTKEVAIFPGLPLRSHETVAGLALTEKGDVFATTEHNSAGEDYPQGYYLYTLNREARRWELVEPPTPGASQIEKRVLGAHGNTLLFTNKDHNQRLIRVE